MKHFSRMAVWAVLLTMGLVRAAQATPMDANPDFKMHVLDPTNPQVPPGGPDYITGLTFSIVFAPCAPSELPDNITADGCFLGFNRSSVNWTSLQFTFQNNAALNQQQADCSLEGKDDIFRTTRCSFQQQLRVEFF